MAALTLAVLVRLRSALVTTLRVLVLVLLLGLGSGVVLVTLTLLVRLPVGALVNCTVRVIAPRKPLAKFVPVALRLVLLVVKPRPLVAVALIRVKPVGRASVMVTFCAAEGPALPIVIT